VTRNYGRVSSGNDDGRVFGVYSEGDDLYSGRTWRHPSPLHPENSRPRLRGRCRSGGASL